MGVLHGLIAALPTVASSWQAVIGYVAVVIASVVVSLKVTRNKNLLNRLKSLPERDRARVLQMEMGAAYLAAGLSPEQWLQQQRQRYYFVGFLVVCSLLLALVIAAVSARSVDPNKIEAQKRLAAQELAQQFIATVYLRDPGYNGAYEMLSDDLKKNLSFAQARDDLIRVMFQLPSNALKHTVEQVVDTAGYLNVIVLSEFSVETRVRDIVTFTRVGTDWKLWHYTWQPIEWPLIWPNSTVTRQSAPEAMKVYSALSQEEKSVSLPGAFKGNITGSTPGWNLVVDATMNPQGSGTCDVSTHESAAATRVELKSVVGGCKLKPGQRTTVNALISGISDSKIELAGVRYFPGT